MDAVGVARVNDCRAVSRERLFKRKTSDAGADGEVVWSWRPDAGAKPCTMRAEPDRAKMRCYLQGDGGKKARSPGRSRISRKTIAQGMFWRENTNKINSKRGLCPPLCRNPQKLLKAVKNF
jgi:hypothetical protein